MNWIAIIWSMTAAACLTLAAIHFMVWWQRRTAWADLLFTLTSVGVAFFAACELSMMLAETPAQFADALRWLQIPTWVVVVSLVGFVRLHFRAGRRWLAWSVFALRSLALLLNFLVGQNLNYREVTALRHIPFLGETVSLGVGVSNPWMLVGQLSLLLLVVFTLDATMTVWRRGDRRQAVVTGGSIVFFALTGMAQAILVLWQMVDMPLAQSFFFLGIVVAIGYEISREAHRAAQLSKELLQSQQRMRLAASAADLSLWEWDFVRDDIWTTEKGRERAGIGASERIDFARFLQSVHPEDREPTERAVLHSLEIGSEFEAKYRMTARDGATRWVVNRGQVERDAHGKPLRMRGVSVDVTERKRSEGELRRLQLELAHVTRLSSMGQLASSLAHELNQPLGAILRNAEAAELMLQADSPDIEEVRAILGDICRDDRRAGAVIDRMRTMLKGRELQGVPLDVNALVSEVAALVRQDAEAHKTQLTLALTPVPSVWADRVQLQQVVLNLLLNAMEAMNDTLPASRLVVVGTRRVGETVEVTVRDKGGGIPADKLTQIFEPFITFKPNGLGMGLAISRSIVEAHGGRLWAENNSDGGATFHFTLPIPRKTG